MERKEGGRKKLCGEGVKGCRTNAGRQLGRQHFVSLLSKHGKP